LFQLTGLLINLPLTDLLSIGIRAFVPELAIVIVTLPAADLLARIECA
jgi:hypothetical protein